MKKKEQIKEFRSLSPEQLEAKLLELSEELLKLRFRQAAGQLEQSHTLKALRRQVAQIRTVLSEMSMSTDSSVAA